MSQNPYHPGALEGGPPPPYHASGPPPAYNQYAPTYSYSTAGPPPPGGPQPGFQPGAPPYQPGAPPYQPGTNPSAPPQPGFQPPGGAPFQPGPQSGYQPNFPMQPPGERGAIIRNIASGLVLDASEYDVKLQHYNGSPYQIWIMEGIGGGRYIIKNKGNGAVLDIEGGPDCGAHLITYEKHGGDNQQWYINNPDRTIVSVAAMNLAIDVCEGECVPGNILIAYEKHGGDNQQFQVQYQ